jgi:ribosomal protein S17E
MAHPYIDKESVHGLYIANDQCGATGASAFDAGYSPSLRTTLQWVDSFHGVKNSAHKWQLLNGRLATAFANGVRTTVSATPGFLEVMCYVNNLSPSSRRKNGLIGYMHRPADIPGSVVVPAGRADEDAAGKLISAYARTMSSLEGQVLAGESREAIQMIGNRGRGLYNSVAGLVTRMRRMSEPARKRRIRQRYRTLAGVQPVDVKAISKSLADTYLETVYGWVPLLNDIRAAKEVLNEYRPPFEYVQGSNVDVQGTVSTTSAEVTQGVLAYSREYRRVDRYSVNYACMARLYYGQNVPTRDLFRNAGVTLQAFVPTIWNLIPYSFLIDYFMNVNEVITGYSYWDSMPGDFARCILHETHQTWWAGNARPSLAAPTFEPKVISQPSTIDVIVRSFHRTRHSTGLPLPRLHFRMPGLRQGLNIGALIASSKLR